MIRLDRGEAEVVALVAQAPPVVETVDQMIDLRSLQAVAEVGAAVAQTPPVVEQKNKKIPKERMKTSARIIRKDYARCWPRG